MLYRISGAFTYKESDIKHVCQAKVAICRCFEMPKWWPFLGPWTFVCIVSLFLPCCLNLTRYITDYPLLNTYWRTKLNCFTINLMSEIIESNSYLLKVWECQKVVELFQKQLCVLVMCLLFYRIVSLIAKLPHIGKSHGNLWFTSESAAVISQNNPQFQNHVKLIGVFPEGVSVRKQRSGLIEKIYCCLARRADQNQRPCCDALIKPCVCKGPSLMKGRLIGVFSKPLKKE